MLFTEHQATFPIKLLPFTPIICRVSTFELCISANGREVCVSMGDGYIMWNKVMHAAPSPNHQSSSCFKTLSSLTLHIHSIHLNQQTITCTGDPRVKIQITNSFRQLSWANKWEQWGWTLWEVCGRVDLGFTFYCFIHDSFGLIALCSAPCLCWYLRTWTLIFTHILRAALFRWYNDRIVQCHSILSWMVSQTNDLA